MPAIDDKASNSLAPLNLRQLIEVLIKHYGITEGQYDLLVNFQVGAGLFGPNPPQETGPGIAVSLAQIGLAPSQNPGSLTVDASKVGVGRRRKAPAAE